MKLRYINYVIAIIATFSAVSFNAHANLDVNNLSKSVVRVVCQSGTGTGFVISNDGYILTNNHVMDGTEACGVRFSGSRSGVRATLVDTDPNKDISIIKISRSGLSPLPLSSELPVSGKTVWALGYPGNADIVGASLTPTATNGPFQRAFRGPMGRATADLVQHGAPVNPGNSGGPLFDGCGRVIGINTFIPLASVSRDGVASATGIYFGTNITESIRMLRAEGITPQVKNSVCNIATNEAETAELQAELDRTRQRLQSDLNSTQQQLSAAERRAAEIEREALAAGSSAEEARAQAAEARALVDLLQASALDAEKRMEKLQKGLFISAPLILLLIFGAIILALRKPRQILVGATRNLGENLSRRISSPSTGKSSKQDLNITIDYDVNDQSRQFNSVISNKKSEGLVIGRNTSLSHHAISDPSISKRHFRITYKDKTSVWLEDLNSSNGTVLKGQSIVPFHKEAVKIGSSFIAGGIRFNISRG